MAGGPSIVVTRSKLRNVSVTAQSGGISESRIVFQSALSSFLFSEMINLDGPKFVRNTVYVRGSVGMAFASDSVAFNDFDTEFTYRNGCDNGLAIISTSSISFFEQNSFAGTGLAVRLNSNANLAAPRNWWGTTDVAQVRLRVYDFAQSASLGTISVPPILTAPPSGMGAQLLRRRSQRPAE